MKRQDLFTLIAYALMITVALLVGFLVIAPQLMTVSAEQPGVQWGVAIGGILGTLVLNAIIFEISHILGAKIGGYKISKVAVLYFNFYRKADDRWSFRFKGYDGLTGETAIVPKKENANPTFYLWGGTIMYAIQLAAVIATFIITNGLEGMAWLNALLTIHVTLGAMILLYNLFPVKLDTKNDGYGIVVMANKTNLQAFNTLMLSDDELRHGRPALKIPSFEELTDYTAEISINNAIEAELAADYTTALETLNKIIVPEAKVSERTKLYCTAEILFIYLLNNQETEAKQLYETISLEKRRILLNNHSFRGVRCYFMISALLDEAFNESLIAFRNRNKIVKGQTELLNSTENVLFERALTLVHKKHPEFDYESGINTSSN